MRKNRKKRQEEAIKRQEIYLMLSNDEKIELAMSRRGRSKKELNKLTKPIKGDDHDGLS